MHPILAKEHPEIPDFFNVIVERLDGKKEEFKAAGFTYLFEGSIIEFITYEDERLVFPVNSLGVIKLGKDFSKILALQEKLAADKLKKEEDQSVKA